MKKSELFFTAILVPLDFATLILAGIAAYWSRFLPSTTSIRPVRFALSYEEFATMLFAVATGWILIFAVSGLYSTKRRKVIEELAKIVFSISTGIAILFALLFFTLQPFESRFIVLAAWLLAVVFVCVERLTVRATQRALLAVGIGAHRVVIIGSGETAKALAQEFKRKKRLGFFVAKIFTDFNDEIAAEIIKLKKKSGVDEIILAEPEAPKKLREELLAFTDTEHLTFKHSADLFAAASSRFEAHTYAGIPIIEIKKTPLDGWGAIYKRIFDIVASFIFLIITFPVITLSAIIILMESGFPIIFRNERVGEKGSLFKTLKLRSMKKELSIGAQKHLGNQDEALKLEKELIEKFSIKKGPVYKIQDDPRVTSFGKFIRLYSIDEMPQLFNIIKGEMSLVGPRPHQPREVAQYKPSYKKVLSIKPGMTGLSQISGRSDLDFESEIRLDTYYIENWNPWLDLYILFKTPLVVLFRKGVY